MNYEEILVNEHDEAWDRPMPVTLLTYENGTMDIHRQSGSQFDEHIDMADKILWKRGLSRLGSEPWAWGMTGGYQSVVKVDNFGSK